MAAPFYIPTNYNTFALRMYSMPPNCALTNGYDDNVYVMFILPQLLHILTNTCYFLVLLIVENEVADLCFIVMGTQPSPLTGEAVSWRLETKTLTHSASRRVAC